MFHVYNIQLYFTWIVYELFYSKPYELLYSKTQPFPTKLTANLLSQIQISTSLLNINHIILVEIDFQELFFQFNEYTLSWDFKNATLKTNEKYSF